MSSDRQAVATQSQKVAAEISASIKECEKATLDWGVQPDHLEGRFVASLLTAIRALARLVAAATSDVRDIVRGAKEAADTEIVKLREANKLAALTVRQAEVVQERIVTNVCKDLSRNLLSESQQWLVLTEKNLHRNRSRIYAVKMTLAALALLGASFAFGYQLRAWEDEPAVQSLARCIKSPLRVVVEGGQPTGDWTCKLDTLVPRTWRELPADMQRRWLWLWRYVTG
ncbi:hypothetical protein [Methylocystis sp.]|uniref:hypothetical protein n=1 Tax=Methylocystis sp. TaxID=1911079 RepID=UPI0025E11DD5|nr:hypothetical protein [Methylocystis sp.]